MLLVSGSVQSTGALQEFLVWLSSQYWHRSIEFQRPILDFPSPKLEHFLEGPNC